MTPMRRPPTRPPPWLRLKTQICKQFAADFHASTTARNGHSTCQIL